MAAFRIAFRAHLLSQQDSKCAICATPLELKPTGRDSAAIDHDHATDAIREVLCVGCNAGLGNFAESTDRLRAAAAYIEKYQAGHVGAAEGLKFSKFLAPSEELISRFVG